MSTYTYRPPPKRYRSKGGFGTGSAAVWIDAKRGLYSDGWLIVKGAPPLKANPVCERKLYPLWRRHQSATAARPIGEITTLDIACVVLRIGRRRRLDRMFAFVDKRRLDFVAGGYDRLSFQIDHAHEPLLVFSASKKVGLIMPMWVGDEARSRALALLQESSSVVE